MNFFEHQEKATLSIGKQSCPMIFEDCQSGIVTFARLKSFYESQIDEAKEDYWTLSK